MTTSLVICATSCTGSSLMIQLNIGWLHWYGVVCWALLRPILLSSVTPHKLNGSPAVQPIKLGLLLVPFSRTSTRQKCAFAVDGPSIWNGLLCRSVHSLELFLRHSFLNLRRFYLVVLGLGAPLS